MTAFLVFTAVVMMALAASERLFDRLELTEDRLTKGLFGLAIGLGAIATTIGLTGMLGFFRYPLVVGFLGAIVLRLLLRDGPNGNRFRFEPGLVLWLRSLPSWRPDGLTVTLTLALAALSLLTLTGALAPPTSNEWDALAYHLAAPKVWLESGRIHPIPYDHHANFPMLAEMFYAIGLDWGSTSLAKSFHWLYGVLGALTCYWAGRRWVSRKAGLLSAMLFLSSPIVAWEMTTAYLDLTATVYVSLAAFAFLIWKEHKAAGQGDGWLWISGILAGFAAGTKYTMLATSGLLVLWCCWLAVRGLHGIRWKHAGILAGVAFVIGGAWYIKTWIWTGNPVYPFAYGLLGGRWWSDQAAIDYVAEQARFGIGKTGLALTAAPWTTVFQAQYYANPPSVFNGSLAAPPSSPFPAVFGSLGLGVLGLLPLMIWTRCRNGVIRGAVLYSGAVFLVWFAMTHQTRYLMPILPLLLTAGVYGARGWMDGSAGRRGIVGVFSVIALLFGCAPLAVLVQPASATAWGRESADAFLSRTEPMYRISQDINRDLPEGTKLLMLQDTRGFWINRPYVWGNPSQNGLLPWHTFDGPEAMVRWLKTAKGPVEGITHILVNWSMTSPEAAKEYWPTLIQEGHQNGYLVPVLQTGRETDRGIVVYRIGGEGPSGD